MAKQDFRNINISKLFLDLNNPRHAPSKNELEAIEYLCSREDVYPLAKDIATVGLNPIDIFAVVGVEGNQGSYVVVEGNRRLCALKLLRDFELAPVKLRKQFKKLAELYTADDAVRCVVFSNLDEASVWIERHHSGVNGGIGRRPWDSAQKTRFIKDRKKNDKNRFALELLDFSEKNNLITEEDRRGKLTTLQRYLSNNKVRELCLGLFTNDDDLICSVRNEDTFLSLAEIVVQDLLSGEIHSRAKKDEIDSYALKIIGLPIYNNAQVLKWPLNQVKKSAAGGNNLNNSVADSSQENSDLLSTKFENDILPSGGEADRHQQKNNRSLSASIDENNNLRPERESPSGKPLRPNGKKNIPLSTEIQGKLNIINNTKLCSIYYSICSIPLSGHTPLLAVGAWTFIESLSVLSGRNPGNDFVSYWSKTKVQSYGFPEKETYSAFNQALKRIQDAGNTTKHHGTAGLFYGEQFANDMEVLEPLLLACLSEIISSLGEAE